jgi:hypothetical protein
MFIKTYLILLFLIKKGTIMNTFYQNSYSFFSGLTDGLLFINHQEQGAAVRQGRDHFWSAFSNYTLLNIAFTSINEVSKALKKPLPLKILEGTVMVLPFAISYVASCEIKNPYLRKFVNILEDYQGHLAFVVVVISNIALFRFGSKLRAVTTLTCLSIGILDRNRFLPESVHRVIVKNCRISAVVMGALFEKGLNRIFCIVELVSAFAKGFFKSPTQTPVEAENLPFYPVEPAEIFTYSDFEKIANDDYKINRSHIDRSILPPIDETIDIGRMLEISNSIPWEKHLDILKKKLAKDERWNEIGKHEKAHFLKDITQFFHQLMKKVYHAIRRSSMQSQPSQSLHANTVNVVKSSRLEIDFFKANLKCFVDSIKNENIVAGRPHSYKLAHKYCKYIIQKLETETPVIQADILMRLGIEGGHYCGPGKFRVIEEIFQSYVSGDNDVPFEIRLLATLQNARVARIQNLYITLLKDSTFTRFLFFFMKKTDIHNFNFIVQAYGMGRRYGLPLLALENDSNIDVAFISSLLADKIDYFSNVFWNGKSIPQRVFSLDIKANWSKPWKWIKTRMEIVKFSAYDQKGIIQDLNAVIGSPAIPKPDVAIWWNNWLERTTIKAKVKKKLLDELSLNASLKGKPLFIKDKVNPIFLIPILQEAGILSKKLSVN